jgi:hypothetical protein
VFNANVCVTAGKVWYGDFDLTLDEAQLLDLAARTGETLYLLYEGDGRFEHEDAPLLDKAVYSVTPARDTEFDPASLERGRDRRLYQRPPMRGPDRAPRADPR